MENLLALIRLYSLAVSDDEKVAILDCMNEFRFNDYQDALDSFTEQIKENHLKQLENARTGNNPTFDFNSVEADYQVQIGAAWDIMGMTI